MNQASEFRECNSIKIQGYTRHTKNKTLQTGVLLNRLKYEQVSYVTNLLCDNVMWLSWRERNFPACPSVIYLPTQTLVGFVTRPFPTNACLSLLGRK